MNTFSPFIINIDDCQLSKEEKNVISHQLVGGIILFEHNYHSKQQLSDLIDEIKSIKEDIIITIDHEGGRVQRFKKDFTILPSFYQISLLDSTIREKAAYSAGLIAGYELSLARIDMNFSPVVDICENEDDPLLSKRTFGNNKESVFNLACHYLDGILKTGLLPVIKHYPGHGLVKTDSHTQECFSDETINSERINNHFAVFEDLNKKFNVPIMTSHVTFKNIDDNIVSYSKKWIDKLNSNYPPFFISDDLEMHSAKYKNSKIVSHANRVKLALGAGCSLIIATTMLVDNIRAQKKSANYFSENYLTSELSDFCKNECNHLSNHTCLDYLKNQNKQSSNLDTLYYEAKKFLSDIILL